MVHRTDSTLSRILLVFSEFVEVLNNLEKNSRTFKEQQKSEFSTRLSHQFESEQEDGAGGEAFPSAFKQLL